MGDGGVAAGGEQRLGALAVVIEAEGDHAAHGVVHLSARLDGLAAAGGLAKTGLEVSLDGVLIAQGEVEAQVEVVGKVGSAAAHAAILLGIGILLLVCLLLGLGAVALCSAGAGSSAASEEAGEAEVVDLVSPSDDEVLAACFVQLGAGHAEIEHAGGLVLHLDGHIVEEGDVEAHQWSEAFVDGDGADVVHGAGDIVARGGAERIAHGTAATHSLDPGAVGVV